MIRDRLLFIISCILLNSQLFQAQTLIQHTTNYFGPNGNPVPDFTDATIPKTTELSLYGDYYFGFGDKTINPYVKLEIPLLPEKISLKLWTVPLEFYSVTNEIRDRRMMHKNSGTATGDLYVQTRLSLLNEKEKKVALILNATIKTASGSDFKNRRFFNTAGYYFDVEMGKSFLLQQSFIDEVRVVANAGFFSWDVQTPNLNVQDDAVMYGLKMIMKKENFSWENTFSGYRGWINRAEDYGNKPILVATKLNLKARRNTYFLQYQNGIQHFPFHQIRLGVVIPIPSVTPNFIK